MKNLMLFLLWALAGCYARPAEETGLEGTKMPSFDLFLADSTTSLNTGSIPAGKPAVLFLFGPHCVYSRAQMQEIIDDMASLKNIQFYIFTTSPFAEMKGFYAEYRLKEYPNITVGVDRANFFAGYFEVSGVPYIAIYGKDKRLRQAFLGKVYGRQIKKIAAQ